MILLFYLKEKQTARLRKQILTKSSKYLRINDIKAFCTVIDEMNMSAAVSALLQASGIGKLKPNILLLGFKNDWRTCGKEDLSEYFATIQ